jgi:urea transport system ATP-binding protein
MDVLPQRGGAHLRCVSRAPGRDADRSDAVAGDASPASQPEGCGSQSRPPAASADILLAVSGLNQYYGGSHILRDISFDVPRGQVSVLLGRNGVGKTTLLKTLMGLVPAARGSVRFENQDITRLAPYRRARAGIGYVPQGREIFPRLTVEENLRMGLASAPRSTPIPARIFELFPVLGSMLRRRGGDLSGGQQQQLAIGRALAMSPRLLILDEPTEGIQPSIIKEIERVIRMLAQQDGMAILLVEQYYDFARALAHRYLVMERGEIVKRGCGEDMEIDGVRLRVAV